MNNLCEGSIYEMLGASLVAVLALMAILWAIYFVKRNAGIGAIGWASGFILTSWIYLLIGDGYLLKKLAMTLMVTIWAARLVFLFYQRYVSLPEDSRFVDIRASWGGDRSGILFLMLFLFKGLLVVILSIPFLIVSHNAKSSWDSWELIGFLIWAAGVVGESIADLQMQKFRSNPGSQEKVYQNGLWRFSRHPNYFFEWVVWIGFWVFALPTQGGWLAIISPALVLALLLKVSGIPLLEPVLLKKKGEAYALYQKTTSPFFPWLKTNE